MIPTSEMILNSSSMACEDRVILTSDTFWLQGSCSMRIVRLYLIRHFLLAVKGKCEHIRNVISGVQILFPYIF